MVTTTSGRLPLEGRLPLCCSGSTPIIPASRCASPLGPQHRRGAASSHREELAQPRAAPLPSTGFGHAPGASVSTPVGHARSTSRARPSGRAFLATLRTASAVSISKRLSKWVAGGQGLACSQTGKAWATEGLLRRLPRGPRWNTGMDWDGRQVTEPLV